MVVINVNKMNSFPFLNKLYLDDKSPSCAKKCKDFLKIFPCKYDGSITPRQFLNNFIDQANVCKLTENEYKKCLLACFNGENRTKIEGLLIKDKDISSLHQAILICMNDATSILDIKKQFYNFIPDKTNCSLIQILATLADLGNSANLTQDDIFYQIISLLPNFANSECRTRYYIDLQIDQNSKPPTPLEILLLFSTRLESLNDELKQMYAKDSKSFVQEKVNFGKSQRLSKVNDVNNKICKLVSPFLRKIRKSTKNTYIHKESC